VVGAHDGAGQAASASFGRGQCVGNQVAYLSGPAMRRIADLYPGEAKTDAKDTAVIADAARAMQHTRRSPNRTVFCSGCYMAGPTHRQTCSRRNKRLDTKAFGTPAKELLLTCQASNKSTDIGQPVAPGLAPGDVTAAQDWLRDHRPPVQDTTNQQVRRFLHT
jgi:hypothetical protein